MMARRTNSPAPDGRDTYRQRFAERMQLQGADPARVADALATEFGVHRSTIYAATRDIRRKLGLSKPRKSNGPRGPNRKKRMSKADAGRIGGLAKRNSKPMDLAGMPVDEAARVLQILSLQWPALRAAFLELDSALVRP